LGAGLDIHRRQLFKTMTNDERIDILRNLVEIDRQTDGIKACMKEIEERIRMSAKLYLKILIKIKDAN